MKKRLMTNKKKKKKKKPKKRHHDEAQKRMYGSPASALALSLYHHGAEVERIEIGK